MAWISIEDELPGLDQPVLAWDGSQQFVAERWCFDHRVDEIYFKPTLHYLPTEIEEITHWRPLPKPPEE